MKRIAKPSLYFSAYPLKAIKEPSLSDKQPDSPFLKALLSGKTKTSSRVRVFPMKNPYEGQINPAPFAADKLPKDIELTEKDWFKNYE
jgi:hypothetical protein